MPTLTKPLIFLRLAGGLGNQLFQLAAASIYSLAHDRNVVVVTSGLAGYSVKRLQSYEFVFGEIPFSVNSTLKSWNLSYLATRFRLGRFPLPWIAVNDKNFLAPQDFTLHYLPIYMDGYFQSGWTRVEFSAAISQFIIHPPSYDARSYIHSGDVAVHVRGSDFLSNPEFCIVNESFYLKCIGLAVARGYNSFVFISDDAVYCHRVLNLCQSAYPDVFFRVSCGSSIEFDFDCIRSATARIVGNSTFAWWATALSSSKTAITWTTPSFTRLCRKPFLLPGEVYVDL